MALNPWARFVASVELVRIALARQEPWYQRSATRAVTARADVARASWHDATPVLRVGAYLETPAGRAEWLCFGQGTTIEAAVDDGLAHLRAYVRGRFWDAHREAARARLALQAAEDAVVALSAAGELLGMRLGEGRCAACGEAGGAHGHCPLAREADAP